MKTKHTVQSSSFGLRLVLCAAAICSMIGGTLLAFLHPEAPSSTYQRTLTFAERVAYQRAMEEIYWRHRLWPSNGGKRPDPKSSLNAVMSQTQLQSKVRDYLRESQALEDYWQMPITAEQLQAEMDRMAKHTKQPEVLRELFQALRNDPFVIAECLARPLLAERLFNSALASHNVSWTVSQPRNFRKRDTAWFRGYTLPAITTALNGEGPCNDAWTATSTVNAPSARQFHTAIWTGTEMIVWGGLAPGYSNSGGRYNPATDSWTATGTTNAPAGRSRHTAVWTGSEMIVWGGIGDGGNVLNTGGRYNPVTDSWTPTSTTNAPAARNFHVAVWTGGEMIVWGGWATNPLNTGGRYNPSTDSWTATSTADAPSARYNHTGVWAGSEMIIWGGEDFSGNFNTGGRYNPGTDSWTATNTTNAPSARTGHTAIWIGSEMVVWGGFSGSGVVNTGGRYSPPANTWTATTLTNAPTGREGHTAVSTGNEMIVWGGYLGLDDDTNTGGRYDPDANSWTSTTIINAPSPRHEHKAVWTGGEMIVWGGLVNSAYVNTGGRYCALSGPTPTSTPTATASPTPTATATASPTPTSTPTPTPTVCVGQYVINQIGDSIVPGIVDIGNHGDDEVTTVALPFPYTLYDQSFTSVNLSSNGNAQFTNTDTIPANSCLAMTRFIFNIYPYWTDLYLVNSGFGIFTSISGTAPNRIFNIEWRSQYYPGSGSANFELRLYEGQSRFDVIYGTVTDGNTLATAGVQRDVTIFTQYFCSGAGGAASGGQSYIYFPPPCPTPTPTCGTPGAWTQAAPVMVDHWGGFMDSNGTVAWEGGGFSNSQGFNIDQFGRFDPVANTWTRLAAMPDLFDAGASGVYAPNVNKLFVFGGEFIGPPSTVVNTTRIYDIATNTWGTGAPMPDVRWSMGSGYFNGKIYLVAGCSTDSTDLCFGQVWEYDPVLNTWNTSRMSMPITLRGPGFGIINGHMYIAGGTNLVYWALNTLYDYDIAANTWTARANMPLGVNAPGSAVIAGKLWLFGGGFPFSGAGTMPRARNKGKVGAWLKRLFNPDTTTALQVYDPGTNAWSIGPHLNQLRWFPAGRDVGNTAVAVGGFDRVDNTTTTSVEVNVTASCGTPTPTATATATATPTVTATATFTSTPTATTTPTSTPSPTPTPCTGRCSPTARPRPSPPPRP